MLLLQKKKNGWFADYKVFAFWDRILEWNP